ncbi:protein Red-like [Paramacrobiotus metropolitanus]|uniref:protein Red-like n=1 Tax=Paramacrobiotus metropolitanus TaxID=2943436 RepID=UPI002446106E|nr:protein Red-like [Paramacrobiotus metropolitanus]
MAGSESVRMTNADFRKILMTPRSDEKPSGSLPSTPSSIGSDRKAKYRPQKKRVPPAPKFPNEEGAPPPTPDSHYRDRAKERRELATQDHEQLIMLAATAGYKAVAPDFQSGLDAAERRRKIIEESKFLGGDIEHTHLVKGLDYALLQKVKAELDSKEEESQPAVEEEEEAPKTKKSAKDLLSKKPATKLSEQDKTPEFKTRLAKNVYNILFNQEIPQRNQFFIPGRMAFLWDLDDEFGNWETPTTLLRSKAELRQEEGPDKHADHHIVIEKLTQILSHLRQGIRVSKKSKKEKKLAFVDPKTLPQSKPPGESIFDDDDGSYKPTTTKLFVRPGDSEVKAAYFKKPEGAIVNETAEEKQKKDHEYIRNVIGAAKKLDIAENGKSEVGISKASAAGPEMNRLRVESGPDSYAECYPGFHEALEAAVDSDEDDDLSKMDHGNNKSAISRKAFDTDEDYSNYMAQREALPKAAFQYGVKMTDGRKKAKSSTKNEKAKINSEWTKISALIQKRKDGGDFHGESKRARNE